MGEPARQQDDPRRLLNAKEVAHALGQSERWARDWIKRMPGRVVMGLGVRVIYKIPARVVEQYKNKGGDQPWRGSTYDEKPGGVGVTTPAENDGSQALISETSEPRNVLRIVSSSSARIKPTKPGRCHSRAPSKS